MLWSWINHFLSWKQNCKQSATSNGLTPCSDQSCDMANYWRLLKWTSLSVMLPWCAVWDTFFYQKSIQVLHSSFFRLKLLLIKYQYNLSIYWEELIEIKSLKKWLQMHQDYWYQQLTLWNRYPSSTTTGIADEPTVSSYKEQPVLIKGTWHSKPQTHPDYEKSQNTLNMRARHQSIWDKSTYISPPHTSCFVLLFSWINQAFFIKCCKKILIFF